MIWFRTLWVIIRAHFRPQGESLAEYRLTCRCLPTDLDLNKHMNNARYHNFLDLARIELYIRSGIIRRAQANGAGTVIGTSTIRFRKEIKVWQKFDVTARIVSWDDRWIYVEHRVLTGAETAAVAILKSAVVSKNGRVSPDQLNAIVGHTGAKPPTSELIAAKNAVDALLTG